MWKVLLLELDHLHYCHSSKLNFSKMYRSVFVQVQGKWARIGFLLTGVGGYIRDV